MGLVMDIRAIVIGDTGIVEVIEHMPVEVINTTPSNNTTGVSFLAVLVLCLLVRRLIKK